MTTTRRKGFTLIELLVVIAIIALLISLLLPALAKAKRTAASLKDKAQLRQIHQAMIIYASDSDEILPTPGLINRQPDPFLNADRPGVGPEDKVKNHSRNVYSCMIAQEFYNPDILIGPTETNPIINEYLEYDYNQYDPGGDTYWDGDSQTGTSQPSGVGFSADLRGAQWDNCNVSYVHLALIGLRKRLHWRSSADNTNPILATRGTKDGIELGEDYEQSQTLGLHGPKKSWVGNIVYGDNHVDVSETFYPEVVSYEPPNQTLRKDNVFAMEFPSQDESENRGYSAGDAFLCMSRSSSPTEAFMGVHHEELLPDGQ